MLPPSGHHPGRGLQLEPGLEPLEVLQQLAARHQPRVRRDHRRRGGEAQAGAGAPLRGGGARPSGLAGSGARRVGGGVHQLDAALHDPGAGRPEPVVDHPQQVRMENVLGVGDPHPLVRDLQVVQHPDRPVQPDRLVVDLGVLRVADQHDAPRETAGPVPGHRERARVVGMVDDHRDGAVRVVEAGQPLEGRPDHVLLEPGREQDQPFPLAAPACRNGPDRSSPAATTCTTGTRRSSRQSRS